MNHRVLIVLFILVFLGQHITAGVVPCSMDMQGMSLAMDHSSHDMDNNDSTAVVSTDSELDSKCPIASCITLILESMMKINAEQSPSLKINSSILSITSQSLTSLYRPPITR